MLSRLVTDRLPATIIALMCGLAVPLAFAPHNLRFTEILSLTAMLLLVRPFSRRFSSFLWFVFAIGMFGYGVWWIQVSVHQFGLPLYSFSITVTAGLIFAQACQLAFFGWLADEFLTNDSNFASLLGIPASWVFVEFFRSWFGSGFPWLILGYAHVESPLAGFAPIGGAYLVSFSAALIATAFYLCIHRRNILWGVPALVILIVGYGLCFIPWSISPPASVRSVALVQGAVPQEIKWHPDVRQPSIDLYTSLTEAHWHRDLIVWPETAIPAFPEEVEEMHRKLTDQANESGTVFVIGSPTREKADTSTDELRYFNSLLLLGGAGGRYDKRHLVPFGEYMPFDSILRPITDLLNVPMSNFSKGEANNSKLRAGDIIIGSSICYEDAYSELLRDSLPEANVLVNVSNDAWFGDTIAPHQHLQISQMRALELGRYMLRATNTGISAIIDQRGRIVVKSEQFEPQALTGDIKLFEGSTPFTRFGSTPIFAICVFLITGLFFANRRSKD